jgi:hypothetical protein
MHRTSLAHDRLFAEIEHALGDRRRLKNLRLRVRQSRRLSDDERQFLLDSARAVAPEHRWCSLPVASVG